MSVDKQVQFPVSIRFEDGTEEQYDDIEDLECNLEDFNSDIHSDCTVRDSINRPLRLIIKLLKVEELSLLMTPNHSSQGGNEHR